MTASLVLPLAVVLLEMLAGGTPDMEGQIKIKRVENFKGLLISETSAVGYNCRFFYDRQGQTNV